MTEINFEEFSIYTNEIIKPEVFMDLYKKEEIQKQFETKITTDSHHPFATFLAKDRKNTKIKQGDFLILMAEKGNKKFEFVSKIVAWGRFSIPKEVIKKLEIKNHEKVRFKIIKESRREKARESFIDFADIKTKIFYRADNFVTIYKSYGTPITLPRFIEITPELIELCFLIHGDGSYKKKFYFVNKNPELIEFVINNFEKIFKIPRTIWRARLLFNNHSDSLDAKENWRRILALNDEQFYPSISKSVLNISNLGNLRVCIDKLVVATIFRYVFSNLQNLGEKPAIHAVNGLLYAEGGVRNEKKGLHKVTLSFSSAEKEMFERLLENAELLKLTRIEQNRRFCISGWNNLCQFLNIFFSNKIIPFDVHNERCNKVLIGFLGHESTQTIESYLKILSEKNDFTIKELREITGYRHNSVFNTLKKQKYSKFVKFEGKGINRNPFKISITDEGRKFLELIKNIKEVYKERYELKTN